jgi:hypothetical protein
MKTLNPKKNCFYKLINFVNLKRNLFFFAPISIVFFISSSLHENSRIQEINLIPVYNGKEYQYIDTEGKIIINAQFSEAGVFRNGLALVKTSGAEPKWGYIAENGKYAIPPKYLRATGFNEDLAWVVSENSPPSAINKKGEIQFTLTRAENVSIFNEGIAPFSIVDNNGEKWGFINKNGEEIIAPQYKKTGRFSEGKCVVENSEGKMGFINRTGELIINYQFDKILERFINGRAIVLLDNKVGVIDTKGRFVINPQYSAMTNDGDNYLFKQNDKYGWCDKDGKIIINPQFDQAFAFRGYDLAPVKSGASWGYINNEGKLEVNPQFDFALPFIGKIAMIESGAKTGFINKEGKYLINPQFDHVADDFLTYSFGGYTNNYSVETDFINIDSIVHRIDVRTPEGLILSNKLTNVISYIEKRIMNNNNIPKLKDTEELETARALARADSSMAYLANLREHQYSDVFKLYTNEHEIFTNEKITKNATLGFYVIADAYKNAYVGSYLKKEFNPDATVEGFSYIVTLSGKGVNKAKDILNAIENSFSGYEKDKANSINGTNIFVKDNQAIKTYIKGSKVVIVIYNNKI